MGVVDENSQSIPDALIDEDSKHFSFIWILPLVAFLAGGWLLYKTLAEKGTEIQIQLETATGIEGGKTKLKYRDVDVGLVSKVRFTPNLAHVLVTAQLVAGMDDYLVDSTRFWVVRPRVGAGGISGLDTLVSGAYIAMDPGKSGKNTDAFIGLEKPPTITSDLKGTSFQLKADQLGSLSVGSPVYFRQIPVGEVISTELADNHEQVDIAVFIQAPHDQFVQANSLFWNVGGVDLSLDATGLRLEMGSLVSLLTGGIAFESPATLKDLPAAKQDTSFSLFDSHAKSQEQRITKGYPYVLHFAETVRGLSVGASVDFRGIRMGTVTDIGAPIDMETNDMVIPVLIEIEPERVMPSKEVQSLSSKELADRNRASIESLVKRGMRARLQTGNLITGQLYVELEIFDEVAPAQVEYEGKYPTLPTVPSPFSGITASLNRLLDKLEKVPLDQLAKNLDDTILSANHLVQTLDRESASLVGDLRKTNEDARSALQSASNSLRSLQKVTTSEGEVGDSVLKTLEELRSAARSIRVMADYLERHPEALIKGKGSQKP